MEAQLKSLNPIHQLIYSRPSTTLSPLPASYVNMQYSANMQQVGTGSSINAFEFNRDNTAFFRELLRMNPELLSRSNIELINSNRAPRADPQWIKYNPTHSAFQNANLVHHHWMQGNIAAAIPQPIRRMWTSTFHPYRQRRIGMNAKLFLAYLPLLRQPAYKLELKGLTDGAYESWELRDTTPIKRVAPIVLPDAPPELRDLFCENDLGNIRFLGGTSFWSEPKKLSEGWGFADMSEANIVVSPSGEIEAYNAHPIEAIHGDSHFLGALAKNLESFLEGMLYAQLNKTHFVSGFPDEDPILYEKTVLVAKHCSLIAGSNEYYDFWAGLLGLPFTEQAT